MAAATGGVVHGPDVEIDGVAFDSRVVQPGQLFVPLVAERDGHEFIAGALTAGAAAYLTSQPPVGGTAIALHLGHRMSIDLDLFSFEDFDSAELHEKLKFKFENVEEVVNSNATLLCLINKIKTDFIRYKYPPQED